MTAERPAARASGLLESAVEKLMADIESPDNRARVAGLLRFAAAFHRYSFNNVMLIWTQAPAATHVAGFRTWLKLGRCVRKGEKGIRILAPCPWKKGEGDEQINGIWFKVVHVFDVSQTDGEPLPDLATAAGNAVPALEAQLVAFCKTRGIAVRTADIGGTFGLSKKGEIVLSDRLGGATRFLVLVHELAHEILHSDADRRDHSADGRRAREADAEAVAYVVATNLGIPHDEAAFYLGANDVTPALVRARMTAILAASKAIIGALEPDADEEVA